MGRLEVLKGKFSRLPKRSTWPAVWSSALLKLAGFAALSLAAGWDWQDGRCGAPDRRSACSAARRGPARLDSGRLRGVAAGAGSIPFQNSAGRQPDARFGQAGLAHRRGFSRRRIGLGQPESEPNGHHRQQAHSGRQVKGQLRRDALPQLGADAGAGMATRLMVVANRP